MKLFRIFPEFRISNILLRISDHNKQNNNKIADLQKESKAAKVDLDDQVNRTLRKTLVFKGIRGQSNEPWDTTREKLNKIIGKKVPTLKDMCPVERAHHWKPKKEGDEPVESTTIFAAFSNWNDAQAVLRASRDGGNFRAEQMFSPAISSRRNQAMLKRRALKDEGRIEKAYVAFPAKLMVKKKGELIYTLHLEF